MVSIGYTLKGEQGGPTQLVDVAPRAEAVRREMLDEALHIMWALFAGETVTFRGEDRSTENTKLWEQVGGEAHSVFFDWAERELLPELSRVA